MVLLSELRRRARHVLGPVLGICAVAYFTYHAVEGDRGLIAWIALRERADDARAVRAETLGQRRAWEHRVGLLRPESLDPDMLDENARRILNYGAPGEVVIFVDRAPPPQ